MNKDELLLPRYKVIADYFYNPYKIGDIITVQADNRSVHLTTTSYRDEFGETVKQANYMHPNRLPEYPHLFKKLEWHEDRKPEDLPKYVRWASGLHANEVHKVEFDFTSDTLFLNNCASTLSKWIGHLIPATLEEYEAYQKTKQ